MQEFVATIVVDDSLRDKSEDIRVASQGGTRPPCRGRIALPDRLAIRIVKSGFDPQGIRLSSQGHCFRLAQVLK